MSSIDRRSLLISAGLIGLGSSLAACGGGGGAPGGTQSVADAATDASATGVKKLSGSLSFVTWASDAEAPAFKKLASDFTARSGVQVKVEVLPYDQIRTVVDRRLQAKQAPDLFRVSYTDVSGYVQTGALADLGSFFGDGFGDAFFRPLWDTVANDGAPVGIPHHTDCSALVYNKAHFAKAGISDVPSKLEDAWTWDEFTGVLKKLRAANTGAAPFAFNYQAYGAYRWFNTLFQNGGTVLDGELKQVTLNTDAAKEALQWTRSLYTQGLHAPSVLVKRPTYPDGIFPTQKISMIQTGDFLIPSLEQSIGKKFEWGATYLPQQKGAATDLGGNAVVATAESKNLEAASEFLKFLAGKEQMKAFCEATTVLPVRNDLAKEQLAYATRPDLMPVFQAQATTMPDQLVKTSTLAAFPGINQALVDNLDQYLADPGASVDQVVTALTGAMEKALKG